MRGFLLWAVPGFLLAFGVVAMFTIGTPFFLAGLVGFAVLYVRGPGWPHDLGLIAGIGVTLLLIAVINAGGDGLDPAPWALWGGGLVAVALVPYLTVMRRRCRSAP